MPAMSRQTLSGATPLGHRLGRLALEVDDLPARRGVQRLAQVEVAVHPLGVQRAAPSASKQRAARRRRASSAGAIDRGPLQPLLHHRRRAWRRAPGRSERHRAGPRGSRPARCRGPRLGGEVRAGAQPVQRELPAVDGVGELLDHHGEVGVQRLTVGDPAGLDPAEQPGDVVRRRPRSARACTSMSRLRPSSSRRNSLSIATSPNITEVLLCWPVNSRGSRSAVRLPGLGQVEARPRPRSRRRIGVVQQCRQDHPARVGILRRVVGDHRAEIGVGEPGDLGVVQVVVRRPAGRTGRAGSTRGSWLAGSAASASAVLLRRVLDLGDLEPDRRSGIGRSRNSAVSVSQGSGVSERSYRLAALAGEPAGAGQVPQHPFGELRFWLTRSSAPRPVDSRTAQEAPLGSRTGSASRRGPDRPG